MRKPIDEVASYIIAKFMADMSAKNNGVVSLPPHAEVVSVLMGFISWAEANNKLKKGKLDISDLI